MVVFNEDFRAKQILSWCEQLDNSKQRVSGGGAPLTKLISQFALGGQAMPSL